MEIKDEEILEQIRQVAKINGTLETLVDSVKEIKERLDKVVDSTAIEIRDIRAKCEKIGENTNSCKTRIAILETKAGILGTVGGTIGGALVSSLIAYFLH